MQGGNAVLMILNGRSLLNENTQLISDSVRKTVRIVLRFEFSTIIMRGLLVFYSLSNPRDFIRREVFFIFSNRTLPP